MFLCHTILLLCFVVLNFCFCFFTNTNVLFWLGFVNNTILYSSEYWILSRLLLLVWIALIHLYPSQHHVSPENTSPKPLKSPSLRRQIQTAHRPKLNTSPYHNKPGPSHNIQQLRKPVWAPTIDFLQVRMSWLVHLSSCLMVLYAEKVCYQWKESFFISVFIFRLIYAINPYLTCQEGLKWSNLFKHWTLNLILKFVKWNKNTENWQKIKQNVVFR